VARARLADAEAAAILGSVDPEQIADDPEHAQIVVAIYTHARAVEDERVR
jgi:hypothetical protein